MREDRKCFPELPRHRCWTPGKGQPWTLPHRAAAAIPAGASLTLVCLQLAVSTRVAWPAGTGVAALACVGAGGPVPAGLVVRAVVEIYRGTLGGGGGERKGRVTHGETCLSDGHAQGRGVQSCPYLGCRRGLPSPPGSCTARAAGRCHGDSQGSGCTDHNIGPASPLCTLDGIRHTQCIQSRGRHPHPTAGSINPEDTHTYLHSPGLSQKPCCSSHPGRQIAVVEDKQS